MPQPSTSFADEMNQLAGQGTTQGASSGGRSGMTPAPFSSFSEEMESLAGGKSSSKSPGEGLPVRTVRTSTPSPEQPSTMGMLRNELSQLFQPVTSAVSGLASIPEAVSTLTDPSTYRGIASTASDVGSALVDPATYRGLYEQGKSAITGKAREVAADPVAAGLKAAYDYPGYIMGAAIGGLAPRATGLGLPETYGGAVKRLTPPPPQGTALEAGEHLQRSYQQGASVSKAGAQQKFERAFNQADQASVKVPTGGTKTMTPPPAQTPAVDALGRPITQTQPPVEVPETVSLREAHEAKGQQTPFREQGQQPTTPKQRMSYLDRQEIEQRMSSAASGTSAQPAYEGAQAAWKDFQDTYRRGPVRKVMGVAPGKVTDFLLNPNRWNTAGRGGLTDYSAGVPRALSPTEVVNNFRKGASDPQTWEVMRQHTQADLLNRSITDGQIDGNVLKQKLAELDKHGVTDQLLPQASDLRALAEKRINQAQFQARMRAVGKTATKYGLRAAGLGGIYGMYEGAKALLSDEP